MTHRFGRAGTRFGQTARFAGRIYGQLRCETDSDCPGDTCYCVDKQCKTNDPVGCLGWYGAYTNIPISRPDTRGVKIPPRPPSPPPRRPKRIRKRKARKPRGRLGEARATDVTKYLIHLGYTINKWVYKSFQSDWNCVVGAGMLEGKKIAPIGALTTETRKALIMASAFQNRMPKPWKNYVDKARYVGC